MMIFDLKLLKKIYRLFEFITPIDNFLFRLSQSLMEKRFVSSGFK